MRFYLQNMAFKSLLLYLFPIGGGSSSNSQRENDLSARSLLAERRKGNRCCFNDYCLCHVVTCYFGRVYKYLYIYIYILLLLVFIMIDGM